MAILRSMDGAFYNVPDNQLSAMLVPADQVKAKLSAVTSSSLPNGAHASEELVTPHGHNGPCRWRNCWSRNCWRNCWHNCY